MNDIEDKYLRARLEKLEQTLARIREVSEKEGAHPNYKLALIKATVSDVQLPCSEPGFECVDAAKRSAKRVQTDADGIASHVAGFICGARWQKDEACPPVVPSLPDDWWWEDHEPAMATRDDKRESVWATPKHLFFERDGGAESLPMPIVLAVLARNGLSFEVAKKPNPPDKAADHDLQDWRVIDEAWDGVVDAATDLDAAHAVEHLRGCLAQRRPSSRAAGILAELLRDALLLTPVRHDRPHASVRYALRILELPEVSYVDVEEVRQRLIAEGYSIHRPSPPALWTAVSGDVGPWPPRVPATEWAPEGGVSAFSDRYNALFRRAAELLRMPSGTAHDYACRRLCAEGLDTPLDPSRGPAGGPPEPVPEDADPPPGWERYPISDDDGCVHESANVRRVGDPIVTIQEAWTIHRAAGISMTQARKRFSMWLRSHPLVEDEDGAPYPPEFFDHVADWVDDPEVDFPLGDLVE